MSHPEYRFRQAQNWFWLESRARLSISDTSVLQQLGKPGLWRTFPSGDHHYLRTFELPEITVNGDDEWLADAESTSSLAAYLAWAMASHAETLPAGWQPPPQRSHDGHGRIDRSIA